MADRKLTVHYCDAPQDYLIAAVQLTAGDIEGKKPDNETAKKLKEKFDKDYYPNWHCVVGRSFGAYVSNEAERAIYFTYGHTSILLFKAG